MSEDGIVIRQVKSQAEYDECVRIQDETWGSAFNERVPGTILKVAQYLGGVAAAAFSTAEPGARMLGFVFGMTGVRNGRLVHWSDMLAVRRDARDRGIGRRLKLYQRSLVKEIGVTQILWTYDPLVCRNAHLNLNTLGARVAEYVPDMYGPDTGSVLHDAIGTDRFVVAWDVSGEAGKRDGAEAGKRDEAGPHGAAGGDAGKRGGGEDIVVAIPGDIQELIATSPETARKWRESTRGAFLHHLADGYRVTGFHRTDDGGFYLLSRGTD